MQYLLTEKEYEELSQNKEKINKINKLIASIYISEIKTYEFNELSYKMLMEILGNQYGCAYRANLSGGEFIITNGHNESCSIKNLVKNL